MIEYDSLLAEATRLPPESRVEFIEALWESLPADAAPPLTEEWMAEIQKRSAEYDAGKVQATPWEEIRAAAIRRAGAAVNDDSR